MFNYFGISEQLAKQSLVLQLAKNYPPLYILLMGFVLGLIGVIIYQYGCYLEDVKHEQKKRI